MDLEPEIVEQLLQIFREELAEELQSLSNYLQAFENQLDEGERPELLQSTYRTAHSIKGAASSVGIQSISSIAYGLEKLFSQLKQDNQIPTVEMIKISFIAIDKMKAAMIAFDADRNIQLPTDEIVQKIESFL